MDEPSPLLLDARGLICPLPVLKARKLLKTAAPGRILVVRVTDPGAPKDFEHFCVVSGVSLVSITARADHTEIVLRQPD